LAKKTDDSDIKMAVLVGLGASIEDAADFVNLGRQTYYNRSSNHPALYSQWIDFGKAAASRILAKHIVRAEKAASNEEKLISRYDKALAVMDKAIQKVETLGDEATLKELLEATRTITHFTAKFAASEAPKRLEVNGSVEHNYRVISDETVLRLTSFMEKNQNLLVAADAIEAEVIS
jgi:hypothetical protein